MIATTATGCLLIGHIDGAMRRAVSPLLHGVEVGGVDLGEPVQTSGKDGLGHGPIDSGDIQHRSTCRDDAHGDIRRSSRVRERADGDKVHPSFSVCANVFEDDAARGFDWNPA